MADGTGGRGVLSVLLNRREVVVPTDAENFRYLRANWRGAYIIVRPGRDSDTWKAIATFGGRDQLIAATADELLEMIRRHYGPSTKGYTEMLMTKLGWKYT